MTALLRRRRSSMLLALAVAMCLGTTVFTHTLPVEPVVTVTMQPEAERLLVQLQVPVAGLADADLPRSANRRLARPAADEILLIVAREIANALSVSEGGTVLPAPDPTVVIAPDEQAVEFLLRYQLPAARGPLSARLHTFPAASRPLAMVATFEAPGERHRTFTVSGTARRVTFEPDSAAVARYFLAHGGRVLLENTDALLMTLCLAVALIARRSLRIATVRLFAGHIAGFVIGAGALDRVETLSSLTVVPALAASVVVAAAALTVVGARPSWFAVLALLFGALNGAVLGNALHAQAPFAGTHPGVAVASVMLVTTIGIGWMIALLATAASVLRARGLPEVVLVYATAAYAGHTALHHLAERTSMPEGTESWLLTRLGSLIVIAWMAALLAVAAVRAMRGRQTTATTAGRT